MIRHSPRIPAVALTIALAIVLAGCADAQKKKEAEAAKNTFACQLNGERLVVRFTDGEARILMPNAQRVTLYQLPGGPGVRYSNGMMELRGKGTQLALTQNGVVTALIDCGPYTAPPAN